MKRSGAADWQRVKRLPPGLQVQNRDLLRRVDLDGVSPKAEAATLDLTTNNLNVRLHRARQRLREKVEATCHVRTKHGCLDCSCGDEQRAEVRRRAAKE